MVGVAELGTEAVYPKIAKNLLDNPFLDDTYDMILLDESEINWQTQNEIHRLLNHCYEKLTKQFTAKTFAYMPPTQRILVYQSNELVGHCGLAVNEITNISPNPLKVGCIGVMASRARTSIGCMLLQEAINTHIKANLPFSIAYSYSRIMFKRIFPRLNTMILNVPTIGKTTRTNEKAKTVIFPAGSPENYAYLNKVSELRVSKEIF